jgi:hypothetical protein
MDMELESELLSAKSDSADSVRIATGRTSISIERNAWHDEEREKIPSRPSEWTEAKAFPLELSRIESSIAQSIPAHAWSSAGDEESRQFDSFHQRGPSTASGHKTRPRDRSAESAEQTETVSLTSLHSASMHGDEDIVRQLASESACSSRDSAGFTPLHFAACYGRGGVLRVLLEARGDANAGSIQGWTPLHLAARNGHVDCLHALLNAGSTRLFHALGPATQSLIAGPHRTALHCTVPHRPRQVHAPGLPRLLISLAWPTSGRALPLRE